MHILIAEDDAITREGLTEIFAGEGYRVTAVADGAAALKAFQADSMDVVCLDVMMPVMDGYTACREIRRLNPSVPVLFISAKGEEIDKVIGLELGADDFIVKPFGVREVIARIRAVTRRAMAAKPATTDETRSFQLNDLEVFPRELRARRGDETIELSLRDVKMLTLFHARPGQVIDRGALFDAGWGEDYLPESRTLDQHISKLRKRIEKDPAKPTIIRTVHGVGYRYDPEEEDQGSGVRG